MNQMTRFVIASSVLCIGLASSGCLGTDDPVETRYFSGDVYDGVTGQQILSYNIAVEHFGRRETGTVDARGGFHLPAIPAYSDFSVYIDAQGYRPFVSHQGQWLDVIHADRSYHYEAYLFATSLTVQDVPVTITLNDSGLLPRGSLRLRPTGLSQVYNEASEQPAGIPTQVWENDLDLLAETVWLDFTDGTPTGPPAGVIPGNRLVYGVPYQLAVLNVPGYQYSQTTATPFVAGVDGRQAIVLSRLAPDALAVAYNSTQDGNPRADGSLIIVLNQPVELDPLSDKADIDEYIDEAFSITAPDSNTNFVVNQLKPDMASNIQERGTTMTISGQQITFAWNKMAGLLSMDTGDPITSVRWGALNQIRLRRAGGNASDVVTLASLLGGQNAITVTVTP